MSIEKLQKAVEEYKTARAEGTLSINALTFKQAIELCGMLGEAMEVMKAEAETAAKTIARLNEQIDDMYRDLAGEDN